MKKIFLNQQDQKGKWAPNWDGPYIVKRVFSGGALILTEMDGNDLTSLINSDAVKKYYALKKMKESKLKIHKGRLRFRNKLLETENL